MNDKAVGAMRDFLESIGIDLKARGMQKTPERALKMFEIFFSGIKKDPKDIWGETFEAGSEGIVAVRHIPFFSVCEHHLVPFFGEVEIAYLPDGGKVAGFSKFTQLVDVLAKRPQLQERLTREIASEIESGIGAKGVTVLVSAQQLCMMIKGELALGTRTVTVENRGRFLHDEALSRQAWRILSGET